MSYSSWDIQKESYRLVPETCPHVDEALENAKLAIKEQTSELRRALCDAIERAMLAEDAVVELNKEISNLQREVSDLEDTISLLRELHGN